MKIFIHADISYSVPRISKKLQFMDKPIKIEDGNICDPEYICNILYGTTYKKINNPLSSMNVTIIRRYYHEISLLINTVDLIILFHNFVEYNNGMDSIISMSILHNIPLIIFSNHISPGFLGTYNYDLKIFKSLSEYISKIKPKSRNIPFELYDYERYIKNNICTPETLSKLITETYKNIEQEKETSRIKLV